MNKRNIFSKAVAWILIATMVNPAAMAPAFARDTDIFLSTTTGSATAEPNIMIVLDTSDSMNLSEDWHEYPGAYDSHVEYLWNDTLVGLGAMQNAENANVIATGVGPTVSSITTSGTTATVTYTSAHGYAAGWTVNVYNATDPLYNGQFTITSVGATTLTYTMTGTPVAPAVAVGGHVLYASSRATQPFSTVGFWGGNTPEDRIALWTAAKAYANATDPLDAGIGVRTTYRNYNDGSWIYWLAASTSTNDPKLRSPSWNRWQGHIKTIGGLRSGVSFSATTDFRTYNRCNDSGNDPTLPANPSATGASATVDPSDGVTPQGLTPSTIYAPTAAPRNSGRYLNQQWVRWERFLKLKNYLFTNGDYTYPTAFSGTNVNGGVGKTIAPGSGTGTINATGITLRNDMAIDLTSSSATALSALRDSLPYGNGYSSNSTNIGSQGLPIRTRRDDNVVNTVDATNDSRSGWTSLKADLGGSVLWSTINGLSAAVLGRVKQTYGLNNNGNTFEAYLGNRDSNPSFSTNPGEFDITTGVPAYYDTPGTPGDILMASPGTVSVPQGTNGFVATNVINIEGAGVGGNNLVTTIQSVAANSFTISPAATLTSDLSGARISQNLKLITVVAPPVCVRTCTLQQPGPPGVAKSAIADPKNNDAGNNPRFYVDVNATTPTTQCVDGSGVAGNLTTGVGITSPQGSYTQADCATTVPAACGAINSAGSSYQTANYAGCVWSGRSSLYVEGQGTYYYGGTCGAAATCAAGAGGATNCVAPGAGSNTVTVYATVGATTVSKSNFCQITAAPTVQNIAISGTNMPGAVLNAGANGAASNSANGCYPLNNVTAACPARPGAPGNPAGCVYVNGGNVAAATANACSSTTSVGTFSTTDYAVFNFVASDNNLYHDCLADNNTAGNPSSGYIKRDNNSTSNTPFNTTWSATYNAAALGTTAPYSASGTALPSGPAVDSYSVNYLNWLFGPKGPNSAPIGRKTRLQIAKDALSGIVASTNGVRFGLMQFNKTSACTASTGTINPDSNTFAVDVDPGFTVGQAVTINGVGVNGAALNTVITSISGTNITFGAATASPTTTGNTSASTTANTNSFTTGNSYSPTTGTVNGGTLNKVTVATIAGYAVGQTITVGGLARTISAIAGSVITFTGGNAVAGAGQVVQITGVGTSSGITALTGVSNIAGYAANQYITIQDGISPGVNLVNAKIASISGSTINLTAGAYLQNPSATAKNVWITVAGPGVNALTNVPAADITNYAVGNSIQVIGGGAYGGTLTTTVSGVNAVTNTITLSAVATTVNTPGSPVTVLRTSPISAGSSNVITSVANITGYAVGQTISVSGAGPGGADLVTTISAIAGSTITMATGATNSVTGATIKLVSAAPQTTASDPSYWLTVAAIGNLNIGDTITVAGAGAAGANLVTTITAVNGLNVKMASKALTAVSSAAVTRAATGLYAAYAGTGTTVVSNGSQIVLASTAGFVNGQNISIAGAGPSGSALATTITAIAGNIITLSDTASTSVVNGIVTIANYVTAIQANPCSGAVIDDGANVARVVKRMGSNSTDTPDYNNRASLITAINALTAASRTPLTESVYEAYRYFSGRLPIWGTLSATATTGGSVTAGRDPAAICTSAGATSGCTGVGNYASPMLNNPNTTTPAGCQKNFVVLITDGGPEDDYSANGDVKSLSWSGPLGIVAARTGLDATQTDTTTNQFESGTPTLPYGPTDLTGTTYDGGYIWLDELTYFMANADVSPGARNIPGDGGTDRIAGRQSVNTYTIGFAGANSPVLQNAALRGNGVYYTADNSSALSAAIIAALAAITSWNPTVAAPTVPISALNRSENATDVYLAFFQPDPSSEWLGTVKKFQLSQYPNNGDATICGAGVGLCLIGQTVLTKAAPNQSPVKNIETITVDVITGISQSAVDDNASSFWAPATVTDGSRPNQGGTGYQLINNTGTLTPETRKVYTFLTDAMAWQDGNSGSTVDLTSSVNKVHFTNSAKISACRMGDTSACPSPVGSSSQTMSSGQQEARINWIRGGDIASTAACADGTSSTCTVWRAWPHADVQHSKPAIVTYQSTPSVVQYMYYVQNNGLLTAIDTATGIEKWSFMVEEALPQIGNMIADSAGAQINIADGTPAIYIEDANGDGNITGSDKVWLFFGLRRGGRVYYAIDITAPDTPQFGWKIDATTTPAKVCVQNGACTSAAQFNELGQTWSTPFIGKVRANSNPVLIFGGGYDVLQDAVPYVPNGGTGGDTMGRAVFVIDAYNTNIVQSWGAGQSGPWLGSGASAMNYAIPSDVTAINTDLDSQGYLDRIYVGDTWGNLFRFDIDSSNINNWNGKLLATLSSDIASGERRKILFPPAAVKQNAPYRFDAVYIGTGDREHPLCLTANQTTPTIMTNTCAVFAPSNKMFMLVDPDYGLVASNSSPIVVSDLYQRTTSDLTTNTSNTILSTYKGWYRDYDNGEKTANAPTVFNERLRFGTYAPLGQSGGACVPPGEGRLNEIDAITGDLVPINGAVSQPSDRYYSTFITHGYISTGQLIVQGKNIYHIVVSDSRLQSVLVGSMGSATKIYWYMEPEQ